MIANSIKLTFLFQFLYHNEVFISMISYLGSNEFRQAKYLAWNVSKNYCNCHIYHSNFIGVGRDWLNFTDFFYKIEVMYIRYSFGPLHVFRLIFGESYT